MLIRFACPACRRYLLADDRRAGKKKKCPACSALVTVPTSGTPAHITAHPPTEAQPNLMRSTESQLPTPQVISSSFQKQEQWRQIINYWPVATIPVAIACIVWLLVAVLHPSSASHTFEGNEAAPQRPEPGADNSPLKSKLFLQVDADKLKQNERASSLSAEELFKRASPAVVRVEVKSRRNSESIQGSGFLVTKDGVVTTNFHVIRGGVSARVFFGDSKQSKLVLGVTGIDADADLALLKIEGDSYPFLQLSGSSVPSIGSKVFAIGSPLGFTNTLSEGLVSGHREIKKHALRLVQTTAPISPGSSGGPLLGSDGNVIGVTTLGSTGEAQNLNLAVPSERLRRLLLAQGSPRQLAAVSGEPLKSRLEEGIKWTREDKGNLVYFFRTLKWERDFSRAFLGKPRITAADELAYAAGLRPDLAHAVRGKMLAKIHPELLREFSSYVRFLDEVRICSDGVQRIGPKTWSLLERWWNWWEKNKKDMRFPDELPVPLGDELDDEWASRFPPFQGIRPPKFVPD